MDQLANFVNAESKLNGLVIGKFKDLSDTERRSPCNKICMYILVLVQILI